jgi:hypothetical protein
MDMDLAGEVQRMDLGEELDGIVAGLFAVTDFIERIWRVEAGEREANEGERDESG